MQKNKWFNKKKTAGILAVVLVAAIALSGTFAFMQNGPHRSSYLSTKGTGIFQLNMSNNFNEYKKETWNSGDTIAAPFFVNSLNYLPEFTEDAYVAVNVMEYIHTKTASDWVLVQEVLGTGTDTSKALFAIDDMGAYMTYAATVTKLGAANVVKYEPVAGTTYGMINGSQTAAQNNAFNGIHGTPMRKPGHEFTYGDVAALDYVKAHGAESPTTDECTADPIQSWAAADAGIATTEEARDYVSFGMTNFMTLADWQSAYTADVNDPALHGDFWILNPNGWAYYAKALPVGQKTANLIDGLTLNETVDEITFYMHYDMVASDITEIDRLGETVQAGLGTFSVGTPTGIKMPGMPAELISSFKNKVVVDSAVIDGDTYTKGADNRWRDEDGNVVDVKEDKDGNTYVKTGDDEWTDKDGNTITQLEMNEIIVEKLTEDQAGLTGGNLARVTRAIESYNKAITARTAAETATESTTPKKSELLAKATLLEEAGNNYLMAKEFGDVSASFDDKSTRNFQYVMSEAIVTRYYNLATTQVTMAENTVPAAVPYYEKAVAYGKSAIEAAELYRADTEATVKGVLPGLILETRPFDVYNTLANATRDNNTAKLAAWSGIEDFIDEMYSCFEEEKASGIFNKTSFYTSLINYLTANSTAAVSNIKYNADKSLAVNVITSGADTGKLQIITAVVPESGIYSIPESFNVDGSELDIVQSEARFLNYNNALKELKVSKNLLSLAGLWCTDPMILTFPADAKLTTINVMGSVSASTNMTNVTLPKTVTSINNSCFVGVRNNITVNYPSTLTITDTLKTNTPYVTWVSYPNP
jgi:hypothetical protein